MTAANLNRMSPQRCIRFPVIQASNCIAISREPPATRVLSGSMYASIPTTPTSTRLSLTEESMVEQSWEKLFTSFIVRINSTELRPRWNDHG